MFLSFDFEILKKNNQNSWFYENVFLRYLVEVPFKYVPSFIHPNYITLVGFGCVVLSYLLFNYTYYKTTGLLLILYYICDCMDGMQARTHDKKSYLGNVLDHGCDIMTTSIITKMNIMGFNFHPVVGALSFGLTLTSVFVMNILHSQTGFFYYGNKYFSIFESYLIGVLTLAFLPSIYPYRLMGVWFIILLAGFAIYVLGRFIDLKDPNVVVGLSSIPAVPFVVYGFNFWNYNLGLMNTLSSFFYKKDDGYKWSFYASILLSYTSFILELFNISYAQSIFVLNLSITVFNMYRIHSVYDRKK